MSQMSPRLSLPYIQPAQAQKHVTHNEALRLLDMLAQLSVLAFDADTPPGIATQGDTYALGASPSGAWSGQAGMLAIYTDGTWTFVTPQDGWNAGSTAGELRIHTGGAWMPVTPPLQNLDGVGINTGSDATNRLAVASDATLLTNDGQGHQLKVNKAAAGDTASLLFQSGFSGHAEMGLAGTNDFAIKVSDDGSTFTTALEFDGATGLVSGAAVQQTPDDTTAGRLMRADFGYGPGNLLGTVSESGGVPTGAVIERGENTNGTYVRFADGSQICTNMAGTSLATDVAAGSIFASVTDQWTFPASFASVTELVVTATSDDDNNWAVARPLNANSAQYRQFSGTSNSSTINTRLLAIGFWV